MSVVEKTDFKFRLHIRVSASHSPVVLIYYRVRETCKLSLNVPHIPSLLRHVLSGRTELNRIT